METCKSIQNPLHVKACRDALALQDGCNLSGIARTLVRLCDEARARGLSPNADRPCQLTVYKLASLCGMEPLNDGALVYNAAESYCRTVVTIG